MVGGVVGLAALAGVAVAAAGLPLKPVGQVALPGPSNRFDYVSIDPAANRLYVAHMNAGELLVFDLGRRRVIRTIPAAGVHGVLAVPQAESGEAAAFAAGRRGLTKLGQQFFASRAHAVAVDSRTHLVYFPLEAGAGGHPELLIMAPIGKVTAAPSGGRTEETGGPVPAPAQTAAWKQIGASVTADPGKPLHFYRAPLDPQALGLVVTSPSSNTISVVWSSYCEFSSDDDKTLEDGGTATGVHSVTAYPPSFPVATLCYVWVSAEPTGTAKLTAAIFAT